MKNIIFISFLFFSQFALCREKKPWFKAWRISKLICPFDCPTMQKIYKVQFKGKKIEFTDQIAESPEFFCLTPNRVNWSGVIETNAGKYLKVWSNNK